jgi:hypothetical protein
MSPTERIRPTSAVLAKWKSPAVDEQEQWFQEDDEVGREGRKGREKKRREGKTREGNRREGKP